MTSVVCSKHKCLNNKNNECTAEVIEYDGLCQSYITYGHAKKHVGGMCIREHGKLKHKSNEVLK
jgi:hypothetical protein